MNMNKKWILLAILYFALSTLITGWFVESSPLYTSFHQKILSCSIAGAKWAIQVVAAFFLLKEKKWPFIKDIGLTAFIGSVVLLPYAIGSILFGFDGKNFFLGSLALAVACMILFYAICVRHARINPWWWYGWLICLLVAITLQLTIVFHVV
jgi:hypothetical protein